MKEWVAEREGASYKVVTNGRASRKSRTEDEQGYRGEHEPQYSDNKRAHLETAFTYSRISQVHSHRGILGFFTPSCLRFLHIQMVHMHQRYWNWSSGNNLSQELEHRCNLIFRVGLSHVHQECIFLPPTG